MKTEPNLDGMSNREIITYIEGKMQEIREASDLVRKVNESFQKIKEANIIPIRVRVTMGDYMNIKGVLELNKDCRIQFDNMANNEPLSHFGGRIEIIN